MDTPSKQALSFLDSWLDYRVRQSHIPGLSVAVGVGSDVVFAKAYGMADVERQEALTTDHIFGMASQSKLFASTAVLQLVQAGKLRLDDPASHYLPWLGSHHDTRVRTITIRQLLSHSAGLVRDGQRTDFWMLAKPFPDANALQSMVLATELPVEPNTQLKYSNMGIALVGQIVEAASGLPYTEYIHDHILKPLKLKHTFADYKPELDNRLATAYSFPYEHQRRPLMPRLPTETFASAVGIHSTPTDMCHFAIANFWSREVLLSDASKKEMQRTQITGYGYDEGWELGLGAEIQRAGNHRLVGHSGHLAGYLTATFFDPHSQLAVSVAVNAKDDTDILKVVRGIIGALDWFAEQAGSVVPKQIVRLNVRLFNPVAVLQVVAVSKGGVVLIDPDDWEPFSFAETCEQIRPGVLRITTPGSAFNEGELVHYAFSQSNEVLSVDYTGQTLLPEDIWRQSVKAEE